MLSEQKNRRFTIIEYLLPFLALTSWLAVCLMAVLNPSGAGPVAPAGLVPVLLFWVLIPLALGSSFFMLIRSRTPSFFARCYAWVIFLAVASILLAARFYHRDFFSLLFQYLLLFFTILLLRFPRMVPLREKQKTWGLLASASWIVFSFFSFWVILMGYAIVTRAEPRWIEAIVYNTLLCSKLAVQAVAIILLKERFFRSLYWEGEDLYCDHRKLSDHLSRQELLLLRILMGAEDATRNCRSFYRDLPAANKQEDLSCETCMAEGWSAVNCKFYRNLKNQLLSNKKYLELLEIGTIINLAENHRENKEKGWKLRLFDDVRSRPPV